MTGRRIAPICRVLGIGRTSAYREEKLQGPRYVKADDRVVTAQIREVIRTRTTYGSRRTCALVNRSFGTGYKVARDRTARDIQQLMHAAVARTPLAAPTRPNERRNLDFVSDALADGRKFRALNIVDAFTRECLVIDLDPSLPGERVGRALEQLRATRALPETITVDTGPALAGNAMDQWAYHAGVTLDFITPGTPVENAYIESFNGNFRDECLNQHWFVRLADARFHIERYRIDDDEVRPHSSLGNHTPAQFAEAFARTTDASTSNPRLSSRVA